VSFFVFVGHELHHHVIVRATSLWSAFIKLHQSHEFANLYVIVDNASGGFSTSANWATGTSSADKYGADYRYRSNASISDAATFTANLPVSGSWTVYVWYPAGANRSSSTPFIISTSAGDHTENVNQPLTGGQ
jgi:hypothetical protein